MIISPRFWKIFDFGPRTHVANLKFRSVGYSFHAQRFNVFAHALRLLPVPFFTSWVTNALQSVPESRAEGNPPTKILMIDEANIFLS